MQSLPLQETTPTITRHGRGAIMHRVVEFQGVLYVGGIGADDRSVSMKGQTEQILNKIGKILQEHGSDKARILSATVFITDMKQKAEMNEAWTAWFAPQDLPTRATIGVAELDPGMLIEVVVTAAWNGRDG